MKLCVVTHEASATGAPILLIEFLEWLKNSSSDIELDIIIIKPGELLDRFVRLGRILKLYEFDRTEDQISQLVKFFQDQKYHTSYFNTVESCHILDWLDSRIDTAILGKIVFHVHELQGRIQFYGSEHISIINEKSRLILCAAEAVRKNLVDLHKFNDNKLKIARGFPRPNKDERAATKRPAEYPLEKNIILGCGEVSVGKGVDLFLNTARNLKKIYDEKGLHSDFKFVWMGRDTHNIQDYFQKEIDILGMSDLIHFAGFQENVWPFFKHADFFYLCSRQDSFPLVCLEAITKDTPVVYYKDAGGIKELLGDDCAYPTPYTDLEKASRLFKKLIENKGGDQESTIIQNAKTRLQEMCDLERNCRQMLEFLLSS
jgi:glycosyltransferase involved in cell wall biosynthesis